MTCTPSHGTVLRAADHNGSAVTVSFGGKSATTEALTVKAMQVTIDYKAETVSFDSEALEVNTAEQFDGTSIADGGSITNCITATGSTVYVRVKAGENTPAGAAAAVPLPARPAALSSDEMKVESAAAGSLTVSWVPASGAGGAAIEYRLRANDGAFGAWQTLTGTVEITGLRAEDSYTIEARKAATDSSFVSASVTMENLRTLAAGETEAQESETETETGSSGQAGETETETESSKQENETETETKSSEQESETETDTGSSGKQSGGTAAGATSAKTGDITNLYLWMAVCALSLLAAGGLAQIKRKKKERR